jgi:TetR/AcrR family transcriptional repressor of bet genes
LFRIEGAAVSSAGRAADRAEGRRAELAEATLRRVACEGLEAATIRGVASEAGTSTGRVVHYFRSKDELLLEALRHAGRRVSRRIAARIEGLEGLASIEAKILAELPLDDESRDEWHIWLAFWSRGSTHPELAAENGRRLERWHAVLVEQLRRAEELQQIPAETNLEIEAERLIALVNGLGVQALFAPEKLTTERLREHVRVHIRSLAAP